MKTTTADEAEKSFSRLLSEVESGETVVITRGGRTIAEVRPKPDDRQDDPVWRAAYEHSVALMRSWPERNYVVGTITEDDKYGDAP